MITGATSSTYTLNNVQYSDTCKYFVIVTNPCGMATSCNATITINKPPVISSQPKSSSVCLGSAITSLTVVATGSGTLSYQWYHNGSKVSGGTNTAIVDLSAVSGDAGNYSVVVSNACGSVTSCIVTITLNTPPVLTCSLNSINLCVTSGTCQNSRCSSSCQQGTSACFTICATGSNLTYQWFENGKPVSACNTYSGCSSSTFCVVNTSGKSGDTYYVVVSNCCGSVTSNTAVLTISTAPVVNCPVCQTVCAGSNVTFTASASGTSPISYQWVNASAPTIVLSTSSVLKS